MPYDIELIFDDTTTTTRKWKITPDNGESFIVTAPTKVQAMTEAERRLTKERPWR